MRDYRNHGHDFSMADRPRSLEDEDDAFWRSQVILDADDEKAGADLYPRLFNVSTGMIYTAVLRTQDPEPAEYVTIPLSSGWGDEENRLHVAVTRWNMQWEAAQFRRWIFREDDLPSPLSELAGRVISTSCWCRVPHALLRVRAPAPHAAQSGTRTAWPPVAARGQWPPFADFYQVDRYLPDDFESRLSRAWASTIWGHIFRKSPMSGFTKSDPIRLLAHNLDYWVPAVTQVIQQEMREWPEVDKGIVAHPVRLTDGTIFGGAVRANPRMGGDVWRGEDEAALMVERTIEAADIHGRFRDPRRGPFQPGRGRLLRTLELRAGGLRAEALPQAAEDQGPLRRADRYHPGAGSRDRSGRQHRHQRLPRSARRARPPGRGPALQRCHQAR